MMRSKQVKVGHIDYCNANGGRMHGLSLPLCHALYHTLYHGARPARPAAAPGRRMR
jgi:hypothetical protein